MTTEKMKKRLLFILISICHTFLSIASDKKESSSNDKDPKNYPTNGIFTEAKESNLIANPGFENLTNNWILGKYNGGAGRFISDSNKSIVGQRSAFVHTTNQNQDYNDVQLFTFLPLIKQAQYSISFMANVQSTCLISISLSNGFETIFEEKLLLRSDIKQYGPFVFKSDTDDPFSFFSFNLGKTSNKIWFDDIVVRADYTDKEFNELLANSGINVNYITINEENSIYISSPTTSTAEMPIILYDDNNSVIFANKIRYGEYEATIKLNNKLDKGNYTLKVFTPTKLESFIFAID